MQSIEKHRSLFEWVIFAVIYSLLCGGIAISGYSLYGHYAGFFVAASVLIAGMVSLYLFHKNCKGSALMRALMALTVALNAGYIVHNALKSSDVKAYNDSQIAKYAAAAEKAVGARTAKVARAVTGQAGKDTEITKAFSDSVSVTAAVLAFIELVTALLCFATASGLSTIKTELLPAERPAMAGQAEWEAGQLKNKWHPNESSVVISRPVRGFRGRPIVATASRSDAAEKAENKSPK